MNIQFSPLFSLLASPSEISHDTCLQKNPRIKITLLAMAKRTRPQKSKVYTGKFMKKSEFDINCTACSSTFSLNTSTGSLKTHLNKCKASIEKGWVVKDNNQPTIIDALEPSLPIEEQEVIDEALIRWLKVRGKPLALVEEEEFKEFTKSLNKKYSVPGRCVLSELQ